MAEAQPRRPLPSLRRYLLFWFAGCAILMVVAYTQLLDYYLELGINLRTQSFLERTATEYAHELARVPAGGIAPKLPSGRSLAGYRDLAAIPGHLLAVFPLDNLRHGEAVRFTNVDLDARDQKEFEVDTLDFCPEGNCELLFLYPYQLAGGEWLYLLHGLVGSDEIYDELELTEQVAFAIGSLFAAALLLVSFLLVRNIDGPLRRLNRWSAAQTAEQSEWTVPSLRFQELDALAHRMQFAFERMREGVNKEKLFLRHASHELRTPIAILGTNVELIDRLTDRPERSEAERAAFLRQYRALDDVRLLIESLLWVNRQSNNLPKSEQINLRGELDVLVDEYSYLLDGRAVSLVVEGHGEATVPAAAARIVLSNLLRNAFQYTIDGEVRVAIGDAEVTVENTSHGDPGEDAEPDDGYGFGLGLELVSLICRRFDWRCTTREPAERRITTVRFLPSGER